MQVDLFWKGEASWGFNEKTAPSFFHCFEISSADAIF